MKELKFRQLRAEEIDIRVGSTKKDQSGQPVGFQLLLYKDARVDANILDETVGAFNWQKRFYQVKNTMICSLGINMNYDEPEKEPYWVWKDDAGDESETEAIKGEASDAFKRSAFAFGGLGRALYTAPFIWVKVDENNHPRNSHYQVKEIDYKDNKISKLVIVNEKSGQVVFSMGSIANYSQNANKPQKKDILEQASNGIADTFEQVDTIVDPLSEEDKNYLQAYVGNLSANDYKSFFDWLNRKYGVSNIVDLNAEQGRKITYYLKNRNK